MNCKTSPTPYYAERAYHPERIPTQPDAPSRNFIQKSAGVRLPWGQTAEVMPNSIMEVLGPESLRHWEKFEEEKFEQTANGTYVPRPFEHLDFHYKHNHEMIRHAQWPYRSQFWIFLKTAGKWLSITLLPIAIWADASTFPASNIPLKEYIYDSLTSFYSWAIGIPLLGAVSGHIVINHFPSLWIQASKGPLWELNRRTGMVTIFSYKHFKKTGKATEFTAPFVEFDAYILTHADRHGAVNRLYLTHRYQNKSIDFSDIIVPDNMPALPFALWDFLQNYMDISRPLPDAPRFEAYRHLDPVTAQYDHQTGRNPRYWIEMDNATFKTKLNEMMGRVYSLDTLSRPNLMAMHVNYAD